MARLRSTIDSSLHELITERRKAAERGDTASYGNDLLGIMLAAASNSTDETATEFNLASVFNNAKLFFFAGQDTVATVLTFTLLQLARYPEWQDRARQEVLEEVGETEAYDSTTLNRLKIVSSLDFLPIRSTLHVLFCIQCEVHNAFTYHDIVQSAGGDDSERNHAVVPGRHLRLQGSHKGYANQRIVHSERAHSGNPHSIIQPRP